MANNPHLELWVVNAEDTKYPRNCDGCGTELTEGMKMIRNIDSCCGGEWSRWICESCVAAATQLLPAFKWNEMIVMPPHPYQWYAVWSIKSEREKQLWWDGAMWLDDPGISNPSRFGINLISHWKENRILPLPNPPHDNPTGDNSGAGV